MEKVKLPEPAELDAIRQMNELALTLDADVLKKCLYEMKNNHSWKESAAVLDPSPFDHAERQEVEAAKLRQLELIIEMAETGQRILLAQAKLATAELTSKNLKSIFR